MYKTYLKIQKNESDFVTGTVMKIEGQAIGDLRMLMSL